MKTLWMALLIFGFHDSWAGPEFVDSPAKCFALKSYPCSLRVTGSFLSFEREAQKYHLGDKSSVVFLGPSEVQLLQGVLWIKDSNALDVRVSPALHLQVSGEIFLERSSGNLLVRNLDSQVEFHSSMVFASESLPIGFQNWYGSISTDGQIMRGMIRPISISEFLKAWIPVAGASFAEMKKRTAVYKESWKGALELSSEIYQKVVERRIASKEEKQQALEKLKRDRLQEQYRLRQMYREKNGFNGL